MSMSNSTLSNPHLTSYEACLLNVASTLERPLTLASLHAAQTGTAGELTIRDVLSVAQQTNLQAGYGKRRLSEFDGKLVPAMLLLTGDQAVVFHGRSANGAFLIFDPEIGEGISEVPEDSFRNTYTGYAILFRRHYGDEISADNTSYQGHWFRAALVASRWNYIQVILAAAMANLLGLTTSIFIMVVYDRVLPNEATESLIALTGGVALALIFDFVLKLLRAGFIDKAGQKADLLMGATNL